MATARSEYVKVWKKANLAKGLCKNCNTPREPGDTQYCRVHREKARVYNQKYLGNLDQEQKARDQRRWQLWRKFRLTPEQYVTMLESQNGGCAICGKSPEQEGKDLVVDHDHATGEIRGLLCNRCNSGIGFLGDTEECLRRALQYLSKREYNLA